MANPNISLLGATYSGVSGVTLPKSGGGTATFPWVEGSKEITQNGTVDVTNLASVIVNVAGGGGSGLEYETGTYTPSSDIARPTIQWANTHSEAPILVLFSDMTGTGHALIVGHTHKPFVTQPGKIQIDPRNNNVKVVPFKVISSTAWMEWGGYAARKMLLPSTHMKQELILSAHNKEMEVRVK